MCRLQVPKFKVLSKRRKTAYPVTHLCENPAIGKTQRALWNPARKLTHKRRGSNQATVEVCRKQSALTRWLYGAGVGGSRDLGPCCFITGQSTIFTTHRSCCAYLSPRLPCTICHTGEHFSFQRSFTVSLKSRGQMVTVQAVKGTDGGGVVTARGIIDPHIFNPLNAELNPICYLLALLAHHFLHVSRIRVKSLTLRLLMSYIYIWSTYSWCF